MPAPIPPPTSNPLTTRLCRSLFSILSFPHNFNNPSYNSLNAYSDSDPSIPLLEAARLANQLLEHILAYDDFNRTLPPPTQNQTQDDLNLRLALFRTGVECRAFVELFMALQKEEVDGNLEGKTGLLRSGAFGEFWGSLGRGVRGLVKLLGRS